MNNKEMAAKVADFVFNLLPESGSREHAVQLFVENLVLPDNVETYTQEYLEECILNFLESH